MNHLFTVTKTDGTQQLFEESKLAQSLKRVGASEQTIDEVVQEVEKIMTNGISTDVIYKKAFDLLKKHSYHTAVKYSIRRGMLELGPDGFPFEKFVARIFRHW
jgi:transcriptional regulator NrdR family protein